MMTRFALPLMERGLLPDSAIRFGIRRLLADRLAEERAGDPSARLDALVAELKTSPIALETEAANEQHYEVPTSFFQKVLGRNLKYSSAYYPDGVNDLDAAEDAMLALTVERAALTDGQRILELGCGWGSLTLYMASHFPASRILAVSNSATQGEFIRGKARERGLENVEVVTADMNRFDPADHAPGWTFDRVVSVEMFEHMRNYQELLRRIAGWMGPEGRLFVHIFCHRTHAYPFEVRDESDWMARYFFTGGLMPSADLFGRFDEDLEIEERWLVDGTHYEKTSLDWVANMDRHREEIWPILEGVYGPDQTRRWWVYWRVFFFACAELFGYRGGEEWLVAHYRFRPSR